MLIRLFSFVIRYSLFAGPQLNMLPEGIDFAFHWARRASCISRGKGRYQKYMKDRKKLLESL